MYNIMMILLLLNQISLFNEKILFFFFIHTKNIIVFSTKKSL